MLSPLGGLFFFSPSTGSPFITFIFLSSLETPGFDPCQGPINEQDGLLLSSGKAILMILFQR